MSVRRVYFEIVLWSNSFCFSSATHLSLSRLLLSLLSLSFCCCLFLRLSSLVSGSTFAFSLALFNLDSFCRLLNLLHLQLLTVLMR